MDFNYLDILGFSMRRPINKGITQKMLLFKQNKLPPTPHHLKGLKMKFSMSKTPQPLLTVNATNKIVLSILVKKQIHISFNT